MQQLRKARVMPEKKLSPMAQLVVAGGETLFGDERWQSPLARISGVSASSLQKLADGSRPVTAKTARKIADALAAEAGKERVRADKIASIAAKIAAKLERE